MKKYLSCLLILFFLIYSNHEILSQPDVSVGERIVPFSVGLYGGLNVNMHSPAFNYPTSTTDGSSYLVLFNNSATGFSGAIGLTALIPLSNIFVISGKLGYNGLGGELEQIKDAQVFKLDASLNYIEILPELQVHNILPVDDLYVIGGFEAGIPLSPKFTITAPSTYTKVENQNIPDASFRMALDVGIGYFYELTKGVNLTPELTFRLPFTDVSSNKDFDKWNVPQLRLSVALTFSLESPAPEPVPEPEHKFNVGFNEVRYYDKEGNSFPLGKIKVEDLKYTEQFPLVPNIFYEENDTIPSKKMQVFNAKSDAGEFTISSLQPDAMRINQSTLDIIGRRMAENPNAELTITGTVDNVVEKDSTILGLSRAEYIKKYLVEKYNISPEKINTRGVGLPEKPSTSKDADGVAENRRIELSSSNPKILEPLLIERENQTLADPNLIEFVPNIETTDTLKEWKLTITQQGEELRSFAGDSMPGVIGWVIIPNELVKSEIPIEYVLWAKNSIGEEKQASGTIPVDYYSFTRKKTEELPDKTIAKFSLILFDFDDDKISQKDLDLIDRDIVTQIKFNSTVKIFGYTDRIGEENYNKGLSDRRAQTVKNYLISKVKTAKYEVFGVGENELLFSNELPVGRQLSRTVQIYIITPR